MEGPPANDRCSICHGSFNLPCQANCSHWFCGNCILQVWNYGSALQPCKCPLCRRQITLLIPSDASSRQRHNSDAAEILGKIERYNRYFGERSNGLIQVSTVKNSSCTNIRNLDAVMHSELLSYSIYRMQQDVSCCGRTNTWHLRLRDLPFLLRRLFRDIMQPQRSLPLVIRARVYLAMFVSAIYIISPVDIIPEGILGIIGLFDDVLIALICFLHVAALYRSVLLFRHGGS
ncbi:unnamed protein product [Camellia sinensis]